MYVSCWKCLSYLLNTLIYCLANLLDLYQSCLAEYSPTLHVTAESMCEQPALQ